MASLATLKTELAAAACFLCLPDNTQQAIKTYLYAVKAGGSLDPKTLLAQSVAFRGIPTGLLPSVQAVFANIIAGGNGSATSGLSGAQCDTACLSEQQSLAIQISTLAQTLSVPQDPKSLAKLSACFVCLPIYQLTVLQTFVMGVASGVIAQPIPGGPPPGIPPTVLPKALTWFSLGYKPPITFNINTGTPPIPPDPGRVIVNNWVNQVITNGGGNPSQVTQNCFTTFLDSIQALLPNIYHMNCIAPDSFIAMRTPLIATVGNLLWVRHNVGTGGAGESLTVNGWTPGADRANCQIYDTGVVPSGIPSFTTGNCGSSLYDADAATINKVTNFQMGGFDGTSAFEITIDVAGFNQAQSLAFDASNELTSGTDANAGGFLLQSRTATNVHTLYKARSSLAWQAIGTKANVNATGPMTSNVYFGGDFYSSVPRLDGTACLYSFMAIHDGFTSAQGQSLFNAVQTMRQCLGGGFL